MTEQIQDTGTKKVGIQDINTFKKAINGMVVKSDRSWADISSRFLNHARVKEYTEKEV